MDLNNQNLMDILCQMEQDSDKNGTSYDCLVPISGGKDGTFILWYLRTHTSLRIQAFHIDNGFVADEALDNAKKICKHLDVDLIICQPAWKQLQLLYNELLTKMGEICIACEYMINIFPFIHAMDKGIPDIVWGLTPHQLETKHIFTGHKENDLSFYNDLVSYYQELFNGLFDSSERFGLIKQWFEFRNSSQKRTPRFLFPFYFMGYDAMEVEETIKKELGWKRSTNVGGTSSNCTINNLHIYLKMKLRGDKFYEEMLEKKRNNGEVIDSVVLEAMEVGDFDSYKTFLQELNISMDEKSLLESISSFNKSILLRKESNISQ